MTHAGEKLCGNRDERIVRDARPFRWRQSIIYMATLVLTLVIGGTALFGFV